MTNLDPSKRASTEVRVERGSANSHCFKDRIVIGDDETIAFASGPWSDRIAAALAPMTPVVLDREAVAREPWHTPRGGLLEAYRVLKDAERSLLHEKSINTHLKGVYEPVVAALAPAIAEIHCLLNPLTKADSIIALTSQAGGLDARPSHPITPDAVSHETAAHARQLKRDIENMPDTLLGGRMLTESEAEAIVALAVRRLIKGDCS